MINFHAGVSSAIGLGVHTTRSLFFDKFIHHILNLDIGKET